MEIDPIQGSTSVMGRCVEVRKSMLLAEAESCIISNINSYVQRYSTVNSTPTLCNSKIQHPVKSLLLYLDNLHVSVFV